MLRHGGDFSGGNPPIRSTSSLSLFTEQLYSCIPTPQVGPHVFIQRRVGKMVDLAFEDYSSMLARLRFKQFERVVCRVGGARSWAAGTIQAINEADPEDPTGRTKLAYVVKIDPPNARLISVPRDVNELVRPEVCFGQCRPGDPPFVALWFTYFCKPLRPLKTRRFAADAPFRQVLEFAEARDERARCLRVCVSLSRARARSKADARACPARA